MRNKNKIIINDDIFDFIYGMALGDAMRRASGVQKGDKERITNNKDIRNVVKNYAEDIINGDENSFNIAIEEIINANRNGETVNCFVFGKIQKLINMTMKYLYIKYYDDPEIKKRFEICDAPMDSIMVNFVYESYYIVHGKDSRDKAGIENIGFKRDCVWSGIDKNTDEYYSFQQAIRTIINKRGLNMNPIEFDYRFWEVAKYVKNNIDGNERKTEDRIKVAKEIWDNL